MGYPHLWVAFIFYKAAIYIVLLFKILPQLPYFAVNFIFTTIRYKYEEDFTLFSYYSGFCNFHFLFCAKGKSIRCIGWQCLLW